MTKHMPADLAQASQPTDALQRVARLSDGELFTVHGAEHERPPKVPMRLECLQHLVTERNLARMP
jgi:hypothetical protein